MNTSTQPVLLSALFSAGTDYHATLRIVGHNAESLQISVIHDSIYGLSSDFFAGNEESAALSVQDRETIVILARNESSVVASGVFEIDTSLVETLGALLRPCMMSNLLFDQCEESIVAEGCEIALTSCAYAEVSR